MSDLQMESGINMALFVELSYDSLLGKSPKNTLNVALYHIKRFERNSAVQLYTSQCHLKQVQS